MRKRRAVRGGPDDVGQVAVPLEEAEQEHVQVLVLGADRPRPQASEGRGEELRMLAVAA